MGAPNQPDAVQQILARYWGFDSFLPLQREAIQSVLDNRDSLVVMPTGGGKSLCYQAPAMCRDGVAVVVSPLLALMKDQVDGLIACGVPAAAVNSTHAIDEKRQVARQVAAGEVRLLYMSPERLVTPKTLDFLAGQNVSFFAIDEAHCISAWGHDFRPEYRGLRMLRDRFPNVAVHAYTATATEPVRRDIIAQLGLHEPEVLVGDFHRGNLQYHVARRERGLGQICNVIDRYRDQSGIVYCISRAEVDRTAAALRELGYSALPYHAGMSDVERVRNQDAFLAERANTIVATVAFGMGIDKSNVRYVVHAGMPKSLEHYQQESGRAGRDGVEAECWLLHSGRDSMTWKRMLQDLPTDAQQAALAALEKMNAYATSASCRHAMLVEHFGQQWSRGPCGACDICLGKVGFMEDARTIGQKILSCVLRVRERFGADYVSQVLVGSKEARILSAGHDQLSTWGLLKSFRRQDVRQWVEQLVSQKYLRKEGEFNTILVTEDGRRLLRGECEPTLLKPATLAPVEAADRSTDSWEGVDRQLFDVLRQLRREIATERGVPAYIVFGDAPLREMARLRPSTLEGLLQVRGVGQQKLADFGEAFTSCIQSYCYENGVESDVEVTEASPSQSVRRPPAAAPTANAIQSFPLFEQGLGVDEVAAQLGRAPSTVWGYLEAYIRHRQISDATPWVEKRTFEIVENAATETGAMRLKPIHQALEGKVSYEQIRIVLACLSSDSVHPLAQ
jgi:ATP-dependent DNA helicase RecQ